MTSRYVEVHDNAATLIGAGVNRYTPHALPGDLAVGMCIQVGGEAEEFDETFAIEASVSGPNLETVFGDTIPIPIMSVSVGDKRLAASLVIPLAIVFTASEAGLHTITLGAAPGERNETHILVCEPETQAES